MSAWHRLRASWLKAQLTQAEATIDVLGAALAASENLRAQANDRYLDRLNNCTCTPPVDETGELPA